MHMQKHLCTDTFPIDAKSKIKLILVTKFTIFQHKCLGNKPSYESIVREVNLQYKIDCYNAANYGNISRTEMKWGPVQKIITN